MKPIEKLHHNYMPRECGADQWAPEGWRDYVYDKNFPHPEDREATIGKLESSIRQARRRLDDLEKVLAAYLELHARLREGELERFAMLHNQEVAKRYIAGMNAEETTSNQ